MDVLHWVAERSPRVDARSRNAEQAWRGIASFSQSVLCQREPFNTKVLFARVVARAFELITARQGTVQFVQVGANDGQSADHLHPFVASGRWRGLLVEPAPVPFERLAKTYAGMQGLQFIPRAIAASEGRLPFYFVEGEDGLSSFSLDTILSHAPKYQDLPGMIREISVETETLDALCDRAGLDRPDVVAVDTEGTDDIVLQSFSLEMRQPSLILFEHCHLPADRSRALVDRLKAANYRLIHDRHDALAIASGTFDEDTTMFMADMVALSRSNCASAKPPTSTM
jgi:FkbM family methyltransferase